MLSEADRHAADLVLAAFNEKDPDLIDQALDASFVEHSVPVGMPPTIESVRRVVAMLVEAMPDFHVTELLRVESDDSVAVLCTVSGTLERPLFGHAATGRGGSWPEVHLFKVANGRVTEHWDVIDRVAMNAALGMGEPHAQTVGPAAA